MTRDAPAHALSYQRPGWWLREVSHLPVACDALDLSGNHVPPVREKEIPRQLVHSLPNDLLLFRRILPYLFFLRILGEGRRVASEAGLYLRQAGIGLLFDRLMAGGARQAHFTRMLLMVKTNRLRTIRPGPKKGENEH